MRFRPSCVALATAATTIICVASCVRGGVSLSPSSWQVGATYTADPLLPQLSHVACLFSTTLPDVGPLAPSSPLTMQFTIDPTTTFTALPAVSGGAADPPASPPRTASGSQFTYSSPAAALPFALRSSHSITVLATISRPTFTLAIVNSSGSAAISSYRNAMEAFVDKPGSASDMASDALCATTTLFKCCLKSGQVAAPGYTVWYLGNNATTVSCTRPSPAAPLGSGTMSAAVPFAVSASLLRSGATTAASANATARLVASVTSGSSTGASFRVTSFSERPQTVAAMDLLRNSRPLVNSTVTFSGTMTGALQRVNAQLLVDTTISLCRNGDVSADVSTPNTIPFFAPGYAFGPSRNQIGYAAATFPADKQCAAPAGYYTTIGTTFNQYDQFASFRSAMSFDAVLAPFTWADSGPLSAASSMVVDGPSNTLLSLDLAWPSAASTSATFGPLIVDLDVGFPIAAAAPAAVVRRFPVMRAMDVSTTLSLASPTTASVSIAFDFMNVEEYASPGVTSTSFAVSHIATNCPTTPSIAATICTAAGVAASNPIVTVRSTAAGVPSAATASPVSSFTSYRAIFTWTVSVQQLLSVISASGAAGNGVLFLAATSYLQLVEVIALQTISVSVPWSFSLDAVVVPIATAWLAASVLGATVAADSYAAHMAALRAVDRAAAAVSAAAFAATKQVPVCAGVDVNAACVPLGSDAACAASFPGWSSATPGAWSAPPRITRWFRLDAVSSALVRFAVRDVVAIDVAVPWGSRPTWIATSGRCAATVVAERRDGLGTATTTRSRSRPVAPPLQSTSPATPIALLIPASQVLPSRLPPWFSGWLVAAAAVGNATVTTSATASPTTASAPSSTTLSTTTAPTPTPVSSVAAEINGQQAVDRAGFIAGAFFVTVDAVLVCVVAAALGVVCVASRRARQQGSRHVVDDPLSSWPTLSAAVDTAARMWGRVRRGLSLDIRDDDEANASPSAHEHDDRDFSDEDDDDAFRGRGSWRAGDSRPLTSRSRSPSGARRSAASPQAISSVVTSRERRPFGRSASPLQLGAERWPLPPSTGAFAVDTIASRRGLPAMRVGDAGGRSAADNTITQHGELPLAAEAAGGYGTRAQSWAHDSDSSRWSHPVMPPLPPSGATSAYLHEDVPIG